MSYFLQYIDKKSILRRAARKIKTASNDDTAGGWSPSAAESGNADIYSVIAGRPELIVTEARNRAMN